MKTKQEVIQQHYIDLLNADKFFKLKPHIDENGWCTMFDQSGEKVSQTFKELGFDKDPLGELVDGGFTDRGHIWRPKSLAGIETNNGWEETGYHHWRGIKLKESPFKNGEYYELGFMGAYGNIFAHQGIYEFNNGFKDQNGYYLKPFPTHYKKLEKSNSPIY